MASKFCNKCEMTKPTYELNHKSDTADGFIYECKSCCAKQKKQWRELNRDRLNQQQRDRHANNPQSKINVNMHRR